MTSLIQQIYCILYNDSPHPCVAPVNGYMKINT